MNPAAQKFYEMSEGEIRLTWEDVENDSLNIVRQMKKEGYEPDVIISIARSGLIPASLVAYALGNKELYVIKVDFSKVQKIGKAQELCKKPKISQELHKDLTGLKVLVIDEMAVSGSTLKLVDKYMDIKGPEDVRYAVLYKQPWSEFKPHYFGREMRQWPVWPWKVMKI